jgi:signal peptidase II
LDLWTKHLIEKNFHLHETKDILGSFFQLILIYNKGGVFGIAQGQSTIFLIISLFVLAFILYTYITYKHKTTLFCLSIGMVLGGALGNMHDRLFNPRGVVDFLWLGWDKYADLFGIKIFLRWPAFNIADAAILVGAVTLAVLFWYHDPHRQANQESTENSNKKNS